MRPNEALMQPMTENPSRGAIGAPNTLLDRTRRNHCRLGTEREHRAVATAGAGAPVSCRRYPGGRLACAPLEWPVW